MSPSSSRIRWEDQSQSESPEDSSQPEEERLSGSQLSQRTTVATPFLDQIGRDLTNLAREGELKPLFGRKKELRKLQRIMLLKQKNNPLIVGASGVGKTALVEGLANYIVLGEVYEGLGNLRIVEISPSSLTAGTEMRGSFEERLQRIIHEAGSDPGLVLFIDEIHTLVRAGAIGGGALDAANILKPALTRGEIRCIGATTLDEFDHFLRKDLAFERRFKPLILDEPTQSEAIDILNSAKDSYEQHHGVVVQTGAVEAAVRLSSQHVLDRRLPDKAFDLLDAACTYARLPDPEYSQQIDEPPSVDADLVTYALAEKLSIPVRKLSQDFRDKLSGVDEYLNGCIFGQPFALESVSSAIFKAFSGLGSPDQPRYVFAFFGSSGVGKTATAKALAEFLFDTPDALIRLDMSEFKESHSISRLFGSPPGYIGYEDEGTFATKLRRQPFSVVLLDEFDKAHPEIHTAFLQIFDEGRFTDARGRSIDARHAIFILTSNLYTIPEINTSEEYEQQQAAIRIQLSGLFRPEFVNRINEIVLFATLDPNSLSKIACQEISNLNERLAQYQIEVNISEEALNWIAKESCDPDSGARAVLRLISKQITEPISNQIIVQDELYKQVVEVCVSENTIVLVNRLVN